MLGCSILGSGLKGLGFGVEGLGFKVWGSGVLDRILSVVWGSDILV